MAKKPDKKIREVAVSRYGWIVFLLFIIFAIIIAYIINIKYVEGNMWREIGEKRAQKILREIPAKRGNIYSDDGRVLATSQPLYNIYIDFMADGIRKDTLMKYVTPLSQELARKFPSNSAATYKKIMLDGWALAQKEKALIEKYKKEGKGQRVRTKSRYVRLIPGDITYLDLKEIQTFPFLNQRSNKTGMISEERTDRIQPFGNLAGRTIGGIYKGVGTASNEGGTSGIELKYDSIIKGIPGQKSRQRVRGRFIDVVEIEPTDGYSIRTTLNIEAQDLAERALYEKLEETAAESGCAIVMEVKTGEIKAIVNLDRTSSGGYAEGNPNAFSYMSEPGSTFKTISLMVALEDKVVTPTDSFKVGDGLFNYQGRVVRDHYWRKGGRKDYMTVTEGMEISSNVVISKMILKGYESNPKRYVDRIHDMGLTQKLEWDVPLKGIEGTANIRFPDNKANPWSKTTLPWMSFGYETQVPPIYILMFYNGIANNGRMIKPFITKEILKDGVVEKELEAEVINSSLSSKKTLRQVQDILRSVMDNGTGKGFQSTYAPIAGKTGTAMIADNGRYGAGYYVSFCGYFPADDPKYTCFVGIRRPKGLPTGGMPGSVFKRIAEGIYFKDMIKAPIKASVDTIHAPLPIVKAGRYDNTIIALKGLKQSYKTKGDGEDWAQIVAEGDRLIVNKISPKEGLVPNVVGMSARDAVYIIEQAGLRVNLYGAGRVVKQSQASGGRVVKGSTVTIELK